MVWTLVWCNAIGWSICIYPYKKSSGRIEIWVIPDETEEIPNKSEPVHPGSVFLI